MGARTVELVEELRAGLYEALVTEGLKARLHALDGSVPEKRALHAAEAPDRIAWHLSRQIERALNDVSEVDRARVGVEVARALLDRLGEMVEVDPSETPTDPARVLDAILGRRPDGSTESITQPLIPLLDTTLLTNAPGEPNLWSQLRSEIESADQIDVVMAFIRRSGISPLVDVLRRHCEEGRSLRVLTTTYTGSTEQAALDRLVDLGADVRVSYDLSTTRLHAKAWVFHRGSGFSTAYVGSSNLTHSAQVTAVEWNVRASAAQNPDVLGSGGFSPTTRYRDYAISRSLIHWESQSTTREDSATGLRYRNHDRDGRSILLFARERADDRAFWFLGPAAYRGHVGEKPMAITWELDVPLPGDLYAAFAGASRMSGV